MAHVITATDGSGSTEPLFVDGYRPSRESRNIIHDLLDGSIGVSYVAPRPRSGELRLGYDNEADAFAAYNLHANETSFIYVSSDFENFAMTYALDGSLDMELDPTGVWIVTVGFQELSA